MQTYRYTLCGYIYHTELGTPVAAPKHKKTVGANICVGFFVMGFGGRIRGEVYFDSTIETVGKWMETHKRAEFCQL